MTKALVCGGREFNDAKLLYEALDQMTLDYIIYGAASGADSLAGRYAKSRNIPCKAYPANWRPKGPQGPVNRGAGFQRNQQMLDQGQPDLVIAFPGGNGTRNMVKIAEQQGFKVIKIGW